MQLRPSVLGSIAAAGALACTTTSVEPESAAPPSAAAAQPDPADAALHLDAGAPDAAAEADAATGDAGPSSVCGEEMVAVEGQFCTNIYQRCIKHRLPWQCAEFEAPGRCLGATRPMSFCIDRYEWPNKKGELPTVMNSWRDAKAACEGIRKRLCTESEWTLACEGPERLPFPYGYARNAEICAIDKRSPKVDENRLFLSRTQAEELARLDQREASGSRPRCVSAFGVFDLTGSVDELVHNESGVPFKSALKGGNWGEYRNACRPSTRGHDEGWRYYQTGFRCCRDAPSGR